MLVIMIRVYLTERRNLSTPSAPKVYPCLLYICPSPTYVMYMMGLFFFVIRRRLQRKKKDVVILFLFVLTTGLLVVPLLLGVVA